MVLRTVGQWGIQMVRLSVYHLELPSALEMVPGLAAQMEHQWDGQKGSLLAPHLVEQMEPR